MPRQKRKRGTTTWQERELRGLQMELKGAKRWLKTLSNQLASTPEDRWAQGMYRHYSERSEVLAAKIEQLSKD